MCEAHRAVFLRFFGGISEWTPRFSGADFLELRVDSAIFWADFLELWAVCTSDEVFGDFRYKIGANFRKFELILA